MPPEDNASSDFEFDSWAREFKLARSTTSILRREGCEDHTALTSLTRSDVLRLDLPVGQCRLLMVALADLGNKNTADFANSGRPEHEDQGADQPSGRRDNCEDEDVPDITSVRRQAERLRQAGERLDNLSGDEERVESRPLQPYRTGRRAVRTARMAGPSSRTLGCSWPSSRRAGRRSRSRRSFRRRLRTAFNAGVVIGWLWRRGPTAPSPSGLETWVIRTSRGTNGAGPTFGSWPISWRRGSSGVPIWNITWHTRQWYMT